MAEEYYVILRTGEEEQFVTRSELETLLASTVATAESVGGAELDRRVKFLIDTACDYPTEPGQYLEWYSVRLEK